MINKEMVIKARPQVTGAPKPSRFRHRPPAPQVDTAPPSRPSRP